MKRFVLALFVVLALSCASGSLVQAQVLYGTASSPDELQQIEDQIKEIMTQRWNDLREVTKGELAYGICQDDRSQIVYAYGVVTGEGTLVGEVGSTVRTVAQNRCGGVVHTKGRSFQMRANGTISTGRY